MSVCYTHWLSLVPSTSYPCSPTHTFSGVSLKTQELFLLVFVTRYLDLLTRYISLYNSLMKILYISATAAIVHMIRYRVCMYICINGPAYIYPTFLSSFPVPAPRLCVTIIIIIVSQEPYRSTYDKMQDSFRLEFAVVPCAVLALLTNLIRGFGIIEVREKLSLSL